MKAILNYPVLSVLFALIFGVTSAWAESVSLSPEAWQRSPEAKLSQSGSSLRVKSLASSIWLVPQQRIHYKGSDVVDIAYKLRGGNLIVQANWFDADGSYLETTMLGKATYKGEQASFRVSGSRAATSTDSTYELKLWVEADMPSLTLESISINQGGARAPMLSVEDFEDSGDIRIKQDRDGSFQLELEGASGSILTQKRFSLSETPAWELNLQRITPSSAFSLQAIFWASDGTYLGHADLLKDETDPSEASIDLREVNTPATAANYSLKFWLSGTGASAVFSILED